MPAEDHKSSAHCMADRISLNAQLYKNVSYPARSEFTVSVSPHKAADIITTKGAKVGTEKIYSFYYL